VVEVGVTPDLHPRTAVDTAEEPRADVRMEVVSERLGGRVAGYEEAVPEGTLRPLAARGTREDGPRVESASAVSEA